MTAGLPALTRWATTGLQGGVATGLPPGVVTGVQGMADLAGEALGVAAVATRAEAYVVVMGAIGALLVAAAVIIWPRGSTGLGARAAFVPAAGSRPGHRAGDDGEASVWQQDPVEVYRRWRLRRRPADLLDDVLELLRGIGPGLEAGLTPSRAIALSATSTLGADRVAHAREAVGTRRRRSRGRRAGAPPGAGANARAAARAGAGPGRTEARTAEAGSAGAGSTADIDVLVGQLMDAADRAAPVSPIWSDWAARSRSTELALVAAAWSLSETTGAPLASAVDRAVRGLLDARIRRGKVTVAVAGPRATVTVLTLLPLTGPLFGLACGIDPVTLYLGSPVASVSVASGLALVWAGRTWCRRMIRSAVRP